MRTTRSWVATIGAYVGTFLPFAMILNFGPVLRSPALTVVSIIIMIVGLGFSIYAVSWLGRSFGAVPAARAPQALRGAVEVERAHVAERQCCLQPRVGGQGFACPEPLERAGREAAIRERAARYAARVEEVCRAHPYNWFNFHDFWEEKR